MRLLQVSKLSALVGLHANYFNNIVSRYEHNEITDFLFFLNEHWAELLYHDQFPSFRADMLDMSLNDLLLNQQVRAARGELPG